jgi:hypothetical protein
MPCSHREAFASKDAPVSTFANSIRVCRDLQFSLGAPIQTARYLRLFFS